jgi:hypothetical protein
MTVETEANGESKSTNGSLGSLCQFKRFFMYRRAICIMYLSDRCLFLMCTCGRDRGGGGWREGEGINTVQVQLEFQLYSPKTFHI